MNLWIWLAIFLVVEISLLVISRIVKREKKNTKLILELTFSIVAIFSVIATYLFLPNLITEIHFSLLTVVILAIVVAIIGVMKWKMVKKDPNLFKK